MPEPRKIFIDVFEMSGHGENDDIYRDLGIFADELDSELDYYEVKLVHHSGRDYFTFTERNKEEC